MVSEVEVSIRGLHLSSRKVRLVAGPLRNLPVYSAQDQLKFMTQKGAGALTKLLASGISAAENDHRIEPERLFVKSLTADDGKFSKRYKARAQGRAFPIRRRTSHVTLILGVSAKPLTEKRERAPKKKDRAAKKPLSLDPEKLSQKGTEKEGGLERGGKDSKESQAPETSGKKRAWYNPFGRSRAGGGAQAPKDVKGKQQKQTFDRRGNM